jgi:hypothetical protein
LTSQLTYSSATVTSLALIKRNPTLDQVTPLATQLHILNLFGGEETPYESLHAVVSCGVKPWFDAFVGARGGGKDGDSKMGTRLLSSFGSTHLYYRDTHDQEKVRRTGTIPIAPSTERGNTRDTPHHSPSHTTRRRTGPLVRRDNILSIG